MASNEKKRHEPAVLEHEYDGIQEYDNPMPRWWLLTFYATIIFSVIYYFNVGPVGNGKGRIADYEAEVAKFAAQHPAPTGGPSVDRLLALVKDREAVREGKEIYAKNCVSCHRADGGGLIGPSLADDYWIHGAAIDSIYITVADGVLAKGMPPWNKMLKPEDVERVVAYVVSLRGSNPANPKAPQGVLVQP